MPLKTCPKCKKGSGPRTRQCACGHRFNKDKKVMATTNKAPDEQPLAIPGTLEYNLLIFRAASFAIKYKHKDYNDLVQDISHGWLAKKGFKPEDVAKTLKRPIIDLFKEVEIEQIE